MNILILDGSPKENSSTMMLTRTFLKGMGVSESDTVTEVKSFHKNIQFCQGDLSCWFRLDHQCILNDDMGELLNLMVDSDYIIWSFPLHGHGMPASLKAIWDRTIAFLNIKMRVIGQRVEHEKTFDLSRKKHIFIVGGGYPYYPENFEGLKLQVQTYLGNPEILCICETALLDITAPDFDAVKNKLLAAVEQAGAEFLQKGHISSETVTEVQKPMIPNDDYLVLMNEVVANARK